MGIDSKKQIDRNLQIIPPEAQKAFNFLSKQKWLLNSDWYLAGGTALALQAGHRVSVDLDFFTVNPDLNSDSILTYLAGDKNWKANIVQDKTLYGELFEAKVSFISYPFFIPEQKFIYYGCIKILNALDIAVMKVIAVSQRGRKRDFFDLYWCANNLESLENIVKRLKIQYPSVAHDYYHILKSLMYFEDAEQDPDPNIYFKASWHDIKNFFTKEVSGMMNKFILE